MSTPAAAHQRPGDHPRRRPGRDPVRASTTATCCSSTRSTGCRGRPRRCSTWRWRTSGSTSSSARARARPRSRWRSRRSRWSAPPPAPGCCPGRCATGSASPPTWSSTSPTSSSTIVRRSRRAARRRAPTPRAPPRSPPARAARPRIANRLLRRVRDYAQVRADGVVTRDVAHARPRPLRGRRSSASTGSTGRSSTRCAAASAADRSASRTLAVAVGEERETVEEVAEPFLVRNGFLARTPRGRVATRAAWEHLGLTPPRPPPLDEAAGPHAVRVLSRGVVAPTRLHFTFGRPDPVSPAGPAPVIPVEGSRGQPGAVPPLVGIALLFWLAVRSGPPSGGSASWAACSAASPSVTRSC